MSTCLKWIKYSGYAYFGICFVLMAFAISLTIKFINYSRANKKSKSSVCLSASFYLTTDLALLASMFHGGLNSCEYNQEFELWPLPNKLYYITFAFFYFLQYHIMLIVLFHRLHAVFINTPYQISNHHTVIFVAIHILFIILIIASALFIHIPVIVFITQIGYGLLLIILIIYITVLFIKKLYQSYEEEEEIRDSITSIDAFGNKKGGSSTSVLMKIITKCTVLTCFSVISSVFTWGLFGILFMTSNSAFFTAFIFLIDVASNLICITLTYRFAEGQYNKYCNIIEMCCKSMLMIHSRGKLRNEMQKVRSRTASDVIQTPNNQSIAL